MRGGPPRIADCAQTGAVVGQSGWPQVGGEALGAGVCAGGRAWDWVGWVEGGGGVHLEEVGQRGGVGVVEWGAPRLVDHQLQSSDVVAAEEKG